jgi:cytochrome c553
MSFCRRWLMPLGLAGFGLAASAQTTADLADLRVRSLAAGCAPCHGTDGRATSGALVPGLAGRPAADLTEQMKGFKSGARAGTVMPQLAKGYSDRQIERLSAYFSAQTQTQAPNSTPGPASKGAP